jgi:hypothetical protein
MRTTGPTTRVVKRKKASHTKNDDQLTNDERWFLTRFFLTSNKRNSAMEAFRCKQVVTADNKAIKVLAKAQAKAYLTKLALESQGSVATVASQAKKVIEELDIISFNDIRDYVDQLSIPNELKTSIKNIGNSARAISEIEFESTGIPNTEIINTKIKVKFHNKLQALTKLGEHHKLFTTLVDLNAKVETPVKWSLPDNGMNEEVK